MHAPALINFNVRNETARGCLLLAVFFVHSLYAYSFQVGDWKHAPLTFALVKLLAPQISIYFFLSGMSLRGIGKKSFRAVLPQSLMLLFLAWVSVGVGIIPNELLFNSVGTGLGFIKAMVKPMVYGTGGCTYVSWFFTVLAVGRILVWIFEKHKIYFALAWLVIAGLILVAKHLHLPDNLYEWRNWPAATLFLVIGMKFPKDWQVPHSIGPAAMAAGLVLTWLDGPGMWHSAPCLTCQINFVAQPMVGEYGFLPAFIIEQCCVFVGLLWIAQSLPPAAHKIGQYFGRASLQFLLLHGWLIASILPLLWQFLPAKGNLLVLAAILFLNPPLHALIFKYTESYLNRVLAFCFAAGRSVTDWIFSVTNMRASMRQRIGNG